MGTPAEILIVDDDRLFLEMVRDILEGAGHSVEAAHGGQQAIDCIAARDFDVVVSDLHMPERGGRDVLAQAREQSTNTEVIILTGQADLDNAISCLRLGAFDIVRKDHELPELIPAVARALERRQLRRASALHEVSRLIFASEDRTDLPERIVRIASQVMQADDASLMLLDINGDLYIAFSNGLPESMHLTERTMIGEGIAGRIASKREPTIIQGAPKEVEKHKGAPTKPHRLVHSSIVYPLVSGDTLLGVLNLNRVDRQRKPFRQADLAHAELLASQIVLALENQQLIRRVTAADKFTAVGQLSTAIAHEINNPITYVLGGITMVRDTLDGLVQALGAPDAAEASDPVTILGGPDGIQELCDILADSHEGAIRIRDVVRDLRSMVRDEQDSMTPFQLKDAIQAALRLSMAELRSIARMELSMDEDLAIRGSRGAMCQVFVNLFINAAHAMRGSGQASGILTVSTSRRGPLIEAIVADTGPGIPPEQLARIFEPFFTTKPVGVGTGLGLSTCRDIVAWHGGSMEVRSKPGEGTTFRIQLPALTEQEEQARNQPEPPALTELDIAAVTGFKILVIDDEEAICRTLTRMLKDNQVTTVNDGATAMELMRRRQDFDIVLCDVVMPGLTGVDVYKQMEAEGNPLAERFFYITGSAGFANVRDFAASKGIRVIEKPVTQATIQAALREASVRN